VEESRNRLESMSDAVLEIAISKAKDPELIKKLRKEAERRGYSFPVPGQSIGEWADEIQVAAYEEEPEQSLEPILPYLERIYPYVVNALLEKDVGDQIYAVMVRNMTQTELELALEAETRPEGLKLLKAEAANRGLIEPEPPAAIGQGAQMVPISLMYPNPANPRKRFDEEELDKLTASVRQLGVLSPILVVQDGDQYRIVAGERRYRAATAAGLDEVPVLIRELTEAEEFEIMLTENIQRQDLDPIEEAQAFQTAVEQGWKQTELAERLGISQAQVANRLRLLKLPEVVQESISREILSAGHGLALAKVAHVPGVAEKIADTFVKYNTPVAKASEGVLGYVASNGMPIHDRCIAWKKPLFDYLVICEKCEMRIMGLEQWSDEERPFCMKPDCWERHQEEAEKQKVTETLQEVAEEKGLSTDTISQLPYLNEMSPSDYEEFTMYPTWVQVEDCGDCEHIRDAIKYSNIVKVCMNPECYNKKKKASKREENEFLKSLKQNFEAKKDSILQTCSLHNQLPRPVLIYMATQAILDPPTSGVTTWTKEKIRKRLYEDRGWKTPKLDGVTWPYVNEVKDLVANLQKLSDRELWDVVLFGLLRGVTEDDYAFQHTLGAQEKEQESEAS
jgi:ParB/RepB/Spo0J family partition protein